MRKASQKLTDASRPEYARRQSRWPPTASLARTTEAHGGQLVAGAVGFDHHHAGAVKPLQLETSRTPDQVHVACVVDLKPKLFKPRLGVARVDIELRKQRNSC